MLLAIIISGFLCQSAAQNPGTSGQTISGPDSQRAQTATLHVTSQLVVLDVVVTSKAGSLRTNLAKNDFHVTENGVPQTILHFEPPAEHTFPANVRVNSTSDLEHNAPQAPVTIIVLDELTTRFEDMGYARYALEKYLSAQPKELSAPTMLLAISAERMQVLMDYTQDRVAILQALKKHLTSYPWQMMREQNPIQQMVQSLGALEQVAQATAGHPGHKNLLWVGHGFPGISLNNPGVDPAKAAALKDVVEQAVDMLRDGRITLNTIDPTAMSSTVSTTENDNSGPLGDIVDPATDPFGGDVNFKELAKASGGRSFFSRNDVDAEIGETARDGLNYYTITYRPTITTDESRAYRKIHVSFALPGLRASLRDGYYTQDSAQVNPATGRSVYDIDAAIENTMVYTGLELHAIKRPGSDGNYVIGISENQISWEGDGDQQSAKLTVVAADISAKGRVLRRITNDITARRHFETSPIAQPELVRAEVNLPQVAGTKRIRFVVRAVGNGRMGSADLALPTTPPASKGNSK